jgi:hypothetical protein
VSDGFWATVGYLVLGCLLIVLAFVVLPWVLS